MTLNGWLGPCRSGQKQAGKQRPKPVGHEVDVHSSRVNPADDENQARHDRQSGNPPWETVDEGEFDWLLSALAPFATRRSVAAQTAIFTDGDAAHSYYCVVSGKLLVHRNRARSQPAAQFVTRGRLFIFDCDGVHMASCRAVVDSVVLRIDRRRFELRVGLDPVLRGVRNSVHANELEWILQRLDTGCGPFDHDKPNRALVADSVGEAAPTTASPCGGHRVTARDRQDQASSNTMLGVDEVFKFPPMFNSEISLNKIVEQQVQAGKQAQAEILDACQKTIEHWYARRCRTVDSNIAFSHDVLHVKHPQGFLRAWLQWTNSSLERLSEDATDQVDVVTSVAQCCTRGALSAMLEPSKLDPKTAPAVEQPNGRQRDTNGAQIQ